MAKQKYYVFEGKYGQFVASEHEAVKCYIEFYTALYSFLVTRKI